MKIGIVTHYYKSLNYGGNLQAYALCKYLNDIGHDAMQVPYDRSADAGFLNNQSFLSVQTCRIRRMLARTYRRFIATLKKNDKGTLSSEFKVRHQRLYEFNQKDIPHTSKIYNHRNIKEVNGIFDAFITGSDQVWHPSAVCGAYFLDFAKPTKLKISYAASIAVDEIDKVYLKRYEQSLKTFSAVSVREENSISIIKDISPVEVVATLDPTLVLRD